MPLDLARPRFQRETWLLLCSTLLFGIVFRGYGTLMRSLYVLRLGFSPQLYGVWVATDPIGFMSAAPVAGWIGLRIGARRAQLLGFGIVLAAYLLMPLTEHVSGVWLQALPMISGVVASAGWATIDVNRIPNLARSTTLEERPQAFAWFNALTGLGSFVGTLVSGTVLAGIGSLLGIAADGRSAFAAGLWLAAALCTLGAVPVLMLPRDNTDMETGHAEREPVSRRLLVVIVLVCLLSQSAGGAYYNFVNPYLDQVLHLSPGQIGAISGAAQICGMLAALASTRMTRWLGTGRDLVLTTLGIGLSLLPVVLIPHWLAAAVSLILLICFYYMWLPQFQNWSMNQASDAQRATVAGASSMAQGSGYALVGLGGGFVVDGLGYRPMFAIGVLLGTVGAAWFAASRSAPPSKKGAPE